MAKRTFRHPTMRKIYTHLLRNEPKRTGARLRECYWKGRDGLTAEEAGIAYGTIAYAAWAAGHDSQPVVTEE